MAEEVKPADNVKDDKKVKPDVKGSWKKYKWYIIGGGAFLALLVLYFLKSGGSGQSNSGAAGTSTDGNVDPATGYLAGSPADTAALGGSGIQSSIPGPAGATGATGKPGKSPDLWDIARKILIGRGIKDPTNSQIWHVRQTLEHIGTPSAPKPTSPKHPVHKPTPVKHPVKK